MPATIKQRTAFKNIAENITSGNPETMGQILVKSGYKKISKQPIRIVNSKGFQELLAEIDDKEILNKFYEILRDEDKRSSLSAGIELLKLKDRYPKDSNKFISLFTKIEELDKEEWKTIYVSTK